MGVMCSFQDNPMVYFAKTNHRDQNTLFGIKRADRLFHFYITGKTGTGKSTLLKTLILQDIHNGEGVTVIDPHGDMVSEIAKSIPKHRKDDLIYFNVPDSSQPYGYNPVSHVVPEKRALAASGMLEVFHKYWGDKAWGQRMEYIFRNALLAILELPNVTLLDLVELLRNDTYRTSILPKITNEQVRLFWKNEYPQYSKRYRTESIAPIQNKVGAFLSDPLLCRVLTASKEPLRFRSIMDNGKILLVNLSKGQLGEDTAGLLGALLVTSLGLAGFSRADIPPEKRKLHFIFMDEFHNFTTLSMANMLSEIRKQNVALTLAHQFTSQLKPEIRDAVLGNAGTIIVFRLGAHDAPHISKEFYPRFEMVDVLNLPNYGVFIKLMIDGAPSKPFSATTIEPQHMSSVLVRQKYKSEPTPPQKDDDVNSVIARE